jgi:hypothetical protein
MEEAEEPIAAAIRSVSEWCDIDGDDELVPLPHVPPVRVYMPGNRPLIVTLYALYAVNAPPEHVPDGILEDAGVHCGLPSHACTHSPTHSLTHPLNYSPTRLFAYSPYLPFANPLNPTTDSFSC